MPVEMIGWIAPRVASEIIPASGPPFSAETVAETARIHERAGFDRVLIGYFSDAPDGFLVGAAAAAVTERLGFLLAHRPGFVAPPVAARKLATLDQLSAGRLAVHIITGGSDADQAKDGDWTDAATRYRRTSEYVGLLRRCWTEPAPFDHDGEFYRTRGTYAEIRCAQQPCIPVYGGGGSEPAIQALAPNVDVFMLWGEPLRNTAVFMDRVRGAAVSAGRKLTFSLSTRPILAATEGQAWDRARAILDQVLAKRGGTAAPTRQNIGSQRLLAAAAEAEVHDTCLWTPLAAATGAQGNSTALVGTPETVAKAMLEYYKLGATSLLIRGYDPRPDAVQYGEELIPRLRQLVAEWDAARARPLPPA
ncbi:MAG TPA: LLM class flavin-dependent oxidoreductase [Stellaceae bacterium]|jgi:alkanesulfonate monooxygenase|nr:LLM class flavin-dependent oxidoreductase [Stellaceae bacterium]